ncbi:sensor histidine kinase [Nocardia jinanensis]|uniref:sensor histidine kinase n=2 Tax=Nocardia jinanensis TaxID=382504 RepID=UPI001E4BDD53|nr:histidine kinase [Nocardia jinanensis]
MTESHLTLGAPEGNRRPPVPGGAWERGDGSDPGTPEQGGGCTPGRPASGAGRWARIRHRAGARAAELLPGAPYPLRELPFDYPPKVVLFTDLAFLVIGVVACLQRHEYFPTALPLIALVLLFASVPTYVLFGIVPRPLPLVAATMIAAGLFFVQPVDSDFAPFVLMVVIAEIAAIAPKRVSITLAVLAAAELLAFALLGQTLWGDHSLRTGLPMYALGIVLGWLVGVMLQYQRLFLYQERENQAAQAAQAAAAERNRIAREVHDVIAHSLTVTLLHVTAARHALTSDRDVDEAADALVDAERLGRQAMADIRRTVGLLDSGPSAAGVEPGADDIPALVDDFVNAGLPVSRRFSGDLGVVSAAIGLALYRICQESLANIVKHAPGAEVELSVAVAGGSALVRVRNTIPRGLPAQLGRGTGVAGMRHRADGLGGSIRVGPEAGGWVVRAEFPLGDRHAGATGRDRLRCPISEIIADHDARPHPEPGRGDAIPPPSLRPPRNE